ncbi:OmpA family protein [Sphingobacterium paludis]|uniref:OmpA family protein n=1 Tax=Sphingobacterium paludis TaxID=1476465 RepID=A0A4R7D2H6_9SPHI|nr:OmpA family protein [Sphingobacterium paludis]TDS13805.1 OmpA family protein [Sphingobacterium paludis]
MKTILLTLGVSFCVFAASAQTVVSTPDSTVEVISDKHRVITNKFFQNWFIGAGAGAQLFYGDHNKQMKFGDRIVPAYEFHLGKWFTPGIGARVAINGLKNKGVTQNGSHSTGVVYDASQFLYNQEFNYINVHGDVLFNLNNLIAGYNPTRFYTLSPYVGLGLMYTWDEPKAKEVSANIGLFNSFRLSDSWDLTLDLRGSLVNDSFDGERGGRKDEGMLTSAVGIVYKFGKSKWDTNIKTVVRYTNEKELNALRDKINELARDNNALKQQLAEAKDKTVTEVVVDEKNMLAAPILVTFPINKSTVSNEARVNLGFFAKVIKESDPDMTYCIMGYADAGTGSKSTNERLSKERAQAIYNILVREFAVPASQLEVNHKGGVDNMFYDDPRLSRAVITIGKYNKK